MDTLTDVLPSDTTLLLRRLKDTIPLAPNDLPILRDIGWTMRAVRRRQAILTEGNKHRSVFFVIDGFLIRYRILRDGQRQVVNLVLPGDFAGVPSCFFGGALYSIKALTPATIATVPLDRVVALFDTQPRLAAKIFWSFSTDVARYVEHLIVVGRRSARERVAHFLLELLLRLQQVGLADECSYELPFSQEVIGDALGLSLAYVNRVLRRLTDDGLLVLKEQKIVIKDLEELTYLADFDRQYLEPLPLSAFAAAS